MWSYSRWREPAGEPAVSYNSGRSRPTDEHGVESIQMMNSKTIIYLRPHWFPSHLRAALEERMSDCWNTADDPFSVDTTVPPPLVLINWLHPDPPHVERSQPGCVCVCVSPTTLSVARGSMEGQLAYTGR